MLPSIHWEIQYRTVPYCLYYHTDILKTGRLSGAVWHKRCRQRRVCPISGCRHRSGCPVRRQSGGCAAPGSVCCMPLRKSEGCRPPPAQAGRPCRLTGSSPCGCGRGTAARKVSSAGRRAAGSSGTPSHRSRKCGGYSQPKITAAAAAKSS